MDLDALKERLENVPPWAWAVGAVVVTAAIFSLYHFSGQALGGWEGFTWGQFVFRMAAGVYLGAIYVWRGFAVAVGAHTLFDVYVVFVMG